MDSRNFFRSYVKKYVIQYYGQEARLHLELSCTKKKKILFPHVFSNCGTLTACRGSLREIVYDSTRVVRFSRSTLPCFYWSPTLPNAEAISPLLAKAPSGRPLWTWFHNSQPKPLASAVWVFSSTPGNAPSSGLDSRRPASAKPSEARRPGEIFHWSNELV